MILITAPFFGDLTSLNEQLPEVVRMAMGATVSRIRIELIFRRCWNLITPCGQHGTAGERARAPIARQHAASRTPTHRWAAVARETASGALRSCAQTCVTTQRRSVSCTACSTQQCRGDRDARRFKAEVYRLVILHAVS